LYQDVSIVVEEAEKLCNKLVKKVGDEIMSDYAPSIPSPSSLPLLPQPDEE